MDIAVLLEQAVKRGDIQAAEVPEVIAELSIATSDATVAALPEDPNEIIAAIKEEHPGIPDIRAQLLNMTIGQKIKFAMMGNAVARSLLIFNPNKMIQEFVLKNPRLTEGEVQAYLKSTNISEHALRIIAGDKDKMKSYICRLNLVCNPKTPGDVAIKWIRYINQTDIKKLAKSKNVSHVVQTTARRMVGE